MTYKKYLKRISKLQKEFVGLYDEGGLVSIEVDRIRVTAELFNKLEEENLLLHISRRRKDNKIYHYKALTGDEIEITAIKVKLED